MGPANNPNLPNISTDPSQVNTPGMQQEVQNVYNQGAQAQGQANNGAMAALQSAGVAGGSESGKALGGIAGQTAQDEGSALSGLQNQQFEEQSGLMNALNSINLQNYANQSQNNVENQDLANAATSGDVGIGGSAIGSIIKAIAS